MNRRVAPAPAKPEKTVAPPPAPRAPARERPRARAWREHHSRSFRASLQRLAARPGATALTLLVMSLALCLPFLLWLLLDNARALGGHLDDARGIGVFLKPELDAATAKSLADTLRKRADVAEVAIRTPEEGLAEFRSQSGFADALKVLQGNPLPTVLIVTPKVVAAANRGAPAIVDELAHDPHVDQVQYDALWRQRLDAILAFTARLAGVLAVLLGLAALLVVGNTVRSDIAGRAEEISVMQLLGADRAFVRRPFLYTGLWYGALAGLVALLLIVGVEIALAGPLGQLTSSYGERFAIHGLSIAQALALFGASIVLGWLGAWIATTRQLSFGRPR
ncbi:MAG: ABC transporter permease [Proteobacteria bacterium]|uniref:permease-like cell division protein FtsX n=1 Tax=Rudaea sp. TaxID=2136325 RepID=UPI0032204BC7|nr:ABC transporter permease [Pseudomonadota bacterium]